MRQVSRLLLASSLALAVLGTSACAPHDFRVRRADAASLKARTPPGNPATAAWSTQRCVETLRQNPVRPGEADPAGQAARREATGRLLTLHGDALLAARGGALRVPADNSQTVTLTLRRGSEAGGADPADYTSLVPASAYLVDRVDQYSASPGEGTPVVGAVRALKPVNSPGVVPMKSIEGVMRALTIVASASPPGSPSAVTLELYDPRSSPRPLAADYTTPVAVNLAHFRPQNRGPLGLIRGGDYFSSTGLYPLGTPTPDKTPLVLVHGLISDPGDFYHLENDLAGSEAVRRRYQVWVFYYPTSLPVVYSAMLLREDVDLFIHRLDPGGTHPALHRAVLVGHSMGGLLSRLAVSEGGERYYRHFFRVPPDQLKLSPADRDLMRRALLSPGSANVAQVIFISTPHRGSRLASGPLGGVGRMLLHMPSSVRQQLHAVLVSNREGLAERKRLQPGSSLDSLTPQGAVIAAVNDSRVRPGVRLHSIIGNQGRPGPLEKSSDGVVPYASSHLPQAESEKIVPAGHTGALKRPETSAEVIRIVGQ